MSLSTLRLASAALGCALLLSSLPTLAANHEQMSMAMDGHAMSQTQTFPLKGEVVKLEDGNVVLAHEAIAALNWPAMTMPFQLATPELAKGLKPGLKIEARFEKVEGDAPRIVSWQAKP